METALMIIGPIIALGVAYVIVPVALDAYRRYRGVKVVTCPETGAAARVELDARAAAITAGLGTPRLAVARCTRWPEHEGCDQACLAELDAEPARRLVA